MKHGPIYLNTGEGAGKTTAALGLALRAVGHGKKVIIIQFMKGRKNIGEWKIQKKLKPLYEIHQFGRPGWVDVYNPSEKDRQLAQEGLKFAWAALKRKPNMLILDEINIAAWCGLLDKKDVLRLLKAVPQKTTLVMTGRRAPKEFIAAADFVNEMRPIKFPKKMRAVRGIQY